MANHSKRSDLAGADIGKRGEGGGSQSDSPVGEAGYLTGCATKRFALSGPFVQPDAAQWLQRTPRTSDACLPLCMPSLPDLIAPRQGHAKSKLQEVIDAARYREIENAPADAPWDPNREFLRSLQFDNVPVDQKIYPLLDATLKQELQELVFLSRMRDDPMQVPRIPRMSGQLPSSDPDPDKIKAQGLRMPLSMFLQVRPQPPGAILNTARDSSAFPAVANGRELARYFEVETPGLPFRQAVDYILRETTLSAPVLGMYAAAVELATAAGLAAAWYFKWEHPQTSCRSRPWECFNQLDVLYDRRPNSTNSADDGRRSHPPEAQPTFPNPPLPGEVRPPEAFVPDVVSPLTSGATPGTPRHPAFPSGHSTYAAAAAYTMIGFFPNYAEQLLRLADNAGLARMWAGIHWRSDHVFGHLVGRAIAELILEQLVHADIVKDVSSGVKDVVYLPCGLRYLQPTMFVSPRPSAKENPCRS